MLRKPHFNIPVAKLAFIKTSGKKICSWLKSLSKNVHTLFYTIILTCKNLCGKWQNDVSKVQKFLSQIWLEVSNQLGKWTETLIALCKIKSNDFLESPCFYSWTKNFFLKFIIFTEKNMLFKGSGGRLFYTQFIGVAS